MFSGWKCQKDWGLAHPANPEVLIGTRIGKDFDGVTYYGTITKFDKWWQVAYDDGTFGDYSYHDLEKQLEPEDISGWDDKFASFIYHPPDENCSQFLVESKGMTEVRNAAWKLRGAQWKLISVFSNLTYGDYSGAYCPEADFVDEMSTMSRTALVAGHETVEISGLKKIQKWIKSSAKLDAEVAERRRASGRTLRGTGDEETTGQSRNRVLAKFTRPHLKYCLHCKEDDAPLDGCYSCSIAIHRNCAYSQEMDRALETRRGSHWCCPKCWKYMFPN